MEPSVKKYRSTIALVLLAPALLVSTGDGVRACGESIPTVITVNAVWPMDVDAYAQGHVGVVQPTYAREYLAKAYRRFTGAARTADAPPHFPDWRELQKVIEGWLKAREEILQTGSPISRDRFDTLGSAGYASYANCTEDAIRTATATLRARAAAWGAKSPELREWLAGQDTVFSHCGSHTTEQFPSELPPTALPLARADRAYQIAAANFYASRRMEAEKRFRAIAEDRQSPWRPFGRYLAVRCLIREATLGDDEARAAQLFVQADSELRSILADPSLERVHRPARQLLAFVSIRVDPIGRAHELSTTIRTAPTVESQDWVDFVWLMDKFLGQQTSYSYEGIEDREALIANDDLLDWILAMQGAGDQALGRALSRWQQTQSVAWLVVAMWKVSPGGKEAPALLAAAAKVPRDSAAYQTLAFLRTRLLTASGDRDAARAVLASVSTQAGEGTPAEAANLFRAQALLLARSLGELLPNVGRVPVGSVWSYGLRSGTEIKYDGDTIDLDGMLLLTEKLPLDRLVESLASKALPERIRARLASATFVRAVMLGREEAALTAARFLRTQFPPMASDFDRYIKAADSEARHRAGILVLVKRTGLKAFVDTDDETTYSASLQPDVVQRDRTTWWCGFAAVTQTGRSGVYGYDSVVTPLPDLTALAPTVPVPEFLTAAERSNLQREMESLAALGTAPNYLLRESVRWARSARSDVNAAEALARAIQATRWACGDDETATHARTAFRVLHAQFPGTEWARRTRYWYDGRDR
jgi:hypothetical protein